MRIKPEEPKEQEEPSTAEYCRVLPSTAEYCRVLPSTAECYSALVVVLYNQCLAEQLNIPI
ncbi:hypothetical protein L2729_12655 [Shewanella gelidimarina]|uniref:hypothetical protein n=1 Tax=Shewanella gelidimarina TaxID=56813 RepID=UPI00200E4ADA|nr:hypothetical protein [Shewanella gelidimarina]MCL1058833.1 hypothetical protein [Shewanella gelidimarina]